VEAGNASIYVEVGGSLSERLIIFTTVTNVSPHLRDETARDVGGVGGSHDSHDSLNVE
jgi:hypothetical protein